MPQTPKETALAIPGPLRSMAQRLGLDDSKVADQLAKTICPGMSQEEVVAFCIVANEHNLNPFKREIYCFKKTGGGLAPMVPIDGWTHIVNCNPEFDGCDFEEHEDPDGKVCAITCTMHVKSRAHPIVIKERLSECFVDTNTAWKKWPCRMLRHKAFMQAARIAFSLGGIFDEDEANEVLRNSRKLEPPRRVSAEVINTTSGEVVDDGVCSACGGRGCVKCDARHLDDEKYPEGDLISESQRRRMFAISGKSGISNEVLKAHLLNKYGFVSPKLITSDIYEEICEWASKPPVPTS